MSKCPLCPNIHDVQISTKYDTRKSKNCHFPGSLIFWEVNFPGKWIFPGSQISPRITMMSKYPRYPNIPKDDTHSLRYSIFRKSIFPGSQISPRISTMSIYPQFMILNRDWWDKWWSTRTHDGRRRWRHRVICSRRPDSFAAGKNDEVRGRTHGNAEWSAPVDLTASLQGKICHYNSAQWYLNHKTTPRIQNDHIFSGTETEIILSQVYTTT